MNESHMGQSGNLPAGRRALFTLVCLILTIAACFPTVAKSAPTLNVTDKNCKIFDEGEQSSNHTWSGGCPGGFAEGEGVHKYKVCVGRQCAFVTDIAITRRGLKTGMSVGFTGDSPADGSGSIGVAFYDNKGEVVEEVGAEKRVMPELPPGSRGLTLYVARTNNVVKAAQQPGIGNGLSLSEVLILWEAWHSNASYQPPTHYDGPTVESSKTGEWYKQRDEYRRSLEERDAERLARRQSAREERDREAAATQQRIAALQRASGVQPTQQSSGTSSSANSISQSPNALGAQAPSLAGRAPLTPAEYQRPSSGTDSRIWLETANIQRCGQYAAAPRKQGDTQQSFTITNVCTMAIQVHMSTNSDTSRFGSMAVLAPGKVERSWWLITTRPEMAFFVCPASGPSGEDVHPDEPLRRCFFRKR